MLYFGDSYPRIWYAFYVIQSEKERTNLEAQVKSCQRMIESLETRSREQVLQIATLKDDSSTQKTTATQMR